ncbi:LysR family transcriptional regulator [Pseudomonas putida]|uniref:LysR family transcriptional regulator n=1 Tax=Pseudomonas putida TaxID=303 RepID=UPI0018AA1BA7|nr:LysR family transcriptional regulator [Pseudomonas putida]MBF8668249.1 LysR family transcriptional regulator [Pseudomonas putida]MBF8711749.1 LysR family transcriptional regulator [Pseudomonas putida]
MDLIKLESFVATVDCGTVSAAAVKLNIGQPAVTKHLNALEADLGVVLFDRSSRRTTLSSEGEKVLCVARQVVGAIRLLREELSAYQ